MVITAEWVSSALRLLSPPRWLEGQHTTETVFRGRGLFYSVAKEPEIKPFQLWYPVIDGLPLRLWVRLPSPHIMRRAGGTAAKASADIRQEFCCV